MYDGCRTGMGPAARREKSAWYYPGWGLNNSLPDVSLRSLLCVLVF
ncbi:hypothetical protein SXCC_03194 [Gluconacetobacter sp. SXCC-1]|nr:hypothetical protein SXCC_03194 [Gluconacetobacter sp. SXCC-1]